MTITLSSGRFEYFIWYQGFRMRVGAFVVFTALCAGAIASCVRLSPQVIGDPKKHGFVLIEGDAVISNIGAVTIENVEYPIRELRGQYQAGRTWFSNLPPGTYRVRELRSDVDFNGNTLRVPQDVDPIPLTFSVAAGELVYLGNIELSPRHSGISDIPGPVGVSIVHGGVEFNAWESVYDLYARTTWEPLILKRMAETK